MEISLPELLSSQAIKSQSSSSPSDHRVWPSRERPSQSNGLVGSGNTARSYNTRSSGMSNRNKTEGDMSAVWDESMDLPIQNLESLGGRGSKIRMDAIADEGYVPYLSLGSEGGVGGSGSDSDRRDSSRRGAREEV